MLGTFVSRARAAFDVIRDVLKTKIEQDKAKLVMMLRIMALYEVENSTHQVCKSSRETHDYL